MVLVIEVNNLKLIIKTIQFNENVFLVVSCTIWERQQTKKAEMSVLDISSAIIERVEAMPETCDYIYIGVALSLTLSLVPSFCRLCEVRIISDGLSSQ